LVRTSVLVGAGLVRYGIHVGIKTVYRIKTDKPLDKLTIPTDQNDTFEEDIIEEVE